MSRRAIDLSIPIDDGMPTYPAEWHPKVSVRQVGFIEKVGRESRELTLGTHTGTHVDAASHFVPGGRTIDQVDLVELTGPARLVALPDLRPGTAIQADDLSRQIGRGSMQRLVIRTDWSRQWATGRYYREYPYFAAATCALLLELGVRVLAMDLPSVDDPLQSGPTCSVDSPNHKALLGNGVTLVENLTNLADLSSTEFTLIAAPLRLRAGDGAPARVFALED